jgi:hypothetical protein
VSNREKVTPELDYKQGRAEESVTLHNEQDEFALRRNAYSAARVGGSKYGVDDDLSPNGFLEVT